jgi:hypothetical protein
MSDVAQSLGHLGHLGQKDQSDLSPRITSHNCTMYLGIWRNLNSWAMNRRRLDRCLFKRWTGDFGICA